MPALAQMPARHMATFKIDAPPATHWHPATCGEVECPDYIHGWDTILDPVLQADLVDLVKRSGRRPARVIHEPGRVTFVFPPGTPCFKAATHRRRLDRPELYLVRGGNLATATTPVRRHRRAADWVDEFRTNNDRLLTRINRG